MSVCARCHTVGGACVNCCADHAQSRSDSLSTATEPPGQADIVVHAIPVTHPHPAPRLSLLLPRPTVNSFFQDVDDILGRAWLHARNYPVGLRLSRAELRWVGGFDRPIISSKTRGSNDRATDTNSTALRDVSRSTGLAVNEQCAREFSSLGGQAPPEPKPRTIHQVYRPVYGRERVAVVSNLGGNSGSGDDVTGYIRPVNGDAEVVEISDEREADLVQRLVAYGRTVRTDLFIDTNLRTIVRRKAEAFARKYKVENEIVMERIIAAAIVDIHNRGPIDVAMAAYMQQTDKRRVDIQNMALMGYALRQPWFILRLWWRITNWTPLSYEKRLNGWVVRNPRIVLRAPK